MNTGTTFLKTMLRLGADRDELSIVGDQIGCPTYGQDIAKSMVSILSFLDLKGSSSGIYHYCGDEPCSWYDFARAIFLEGEVQGLKIPSNVIVHYDGRLSDSRSSACLFGIRLQ